MENNDSFSDRGQHFEEKFEQLKEEIQEEQYEIKHLQEKLNKEQRELHQLVEKEEKLEEEFKEHKRHHSHRSLVFVVNGEEVVEEVDIDQPLRIFAEKALHQSGNTARPLSDYQVLYQDKEISLDKKVVNYHFSLNALIYLNLNQAGGGQL